MMMKKTMAVPRVNLNGTSKGQLLEDVQTVGAKVREAMDALTKASPHPRDYSPEGMEDAVMEYHDRMAKLKSVYEDMLALSEAIDDQPGGRS